MEAAFRAERFNLKSGGEAAHYLSQLSIELGLKAAETARHYFAFACAKEAGSDVSMASATEFKKYLEKNAGLKKGVSRPRESEHNFPTPKRPATEASITNAPTPPAATVTRGGALQPGPSPPPSTFVNRANKGQVLSSLHDNIELPEASSPSPSPSSFHTLGDSLVVPGLRHLHMNDTLEGRVHAINDRILDLAESFRKLVPEARGILRSSVSEVTQEAVWVAGRIVPESEGHAMNDQSVLIEGSREGSSGSRVKLDLSHLVAFRIFPGQIVFVLGINPTGSCLIAQRMVTHVPPPPLPLQARRPAHVVPPPSSSSPLPRDSEDDGAASFSMVVAAGPFSISDNLSYEPLVDLLSHCDEEGVTDLVLFGPFVDVEHPLVKDGSHLRVTFQQLFEDQVASRVRAWRQKGSKGRRVTLIPSIRDANAPPVFPQPPLSLDPPSMDGEEIGAAAIHSPPQQDEALRSLQSPVAFVSGGVSIAGSSHDILMHLSASELSRGQEAGGGGRMPALASHVIGQQSFYPLFPPPLGACLDLSHASHLRIETLPDLLLLPSTLNAFAAELPLSRMTSSMPGSLAKPLPVEQELTFRPLGVTLLPQTTSPSLNPKTAEVASVIAVNPGRLSKGAGWGTFAQIYVAGRKEGEAANAPVADRMRVDIRRL